MADISNALQVQNERFLSKIFAAQEAKETIKAQKAEETNDEIKETKISAYCTDILIEIAEIISYNTRIPKMYDIQRTRAEI